MVCFTKYQVYLHFSNECLISVEGEISLDRSERMRLPVALSNLYPLIDQKIKSTSSTIAGTLALVFDEGQTLLIYDSSEQFESYAITEHGAVIVRV